MSALEVIVFIMFYLVINNKNSYVSARDEHVSLCASGVNVTYENYTVNESKNCKCKNETKCVRKCCQSGFYHYHYEDGGGIFESVCIKHNFTSFSVPIYEGTTKKYNVSDGFIIGTLQCVGNRGWKYFKMNNSNPREAFYIQENGTLYYPASKRKIYSNSKYCVDEEDGLTAYLCYSPDKLSVRIWKSVHNMANNQCYRNFTCLKSSHGLVPDLVLLGEYPTNWLS
ncbi:hypothetical protein NQ315_004564 [Exocentrus adspersus]|uniref:Uncharacterized protein n=1 Tax=Exocentrus adspersus TaxID=1586481 RepID=A0AAV8VN08_9CUCU|nr:hypothetical protein NQ315_004564 [Exocentrus adspersus]